MTEHEVNEIVFESQIQYPLEINDKEISNDYLIR